jgi:branched-chain amino acid transport system permease protein
LQAIVSGILIGGIYGLVSMGLSLVFGVMRIVNFAHGELVMLGMYGTFFTAMIFGVDPFLTIIVVAPSLFFLGIYIQKYLIQSVVGADDTPQLLITVGISLFLQNVILIFFSADYRSLNSDYAVTYLSAGPVVLNKAQLFAFIVAAVCSALMAYFLTRTDLGKALRATVNDLDMAELVGVNTKKMYKVTFGLGTLLAAIGGSALITYYPASPTVGHHFLIIAFVCVVMGGMGNVMGAFASGILIGVIQQVTATYIGIGMQNIAIYILFITLLLFRPNGIFGEKVGNSV